MPNTTTPDSVRQWLDQRALQLEKEVAAAQSLASHHTDAEVTDRKEIANDRASAVVGSAEVERDLAELREITLARERLQAGTYGLCASCGESIDARRLTAKPTAIRCVACQGVAEAQ